MEEASGFYCPWGGSENPITRENVNEGLQFFKMNGKAVYQTAIEVLPKAIIKYLKIPDYDC